jgi:hypothetical protein
VTDEEIEKLALVTWEWARCDFVHGPNAIRTALCFVRDVTREAAAKTCREIADHHGTDAEGANDPEFSNAIVAGRVARQCAAAIRSG